MRSKALSFLCGLGRSRLSLWGGSEVPTFAGCSCVCKVVRYLLKRLKLKDIVEGCKVLAPLVVLWLRAILAFFVCDKEHFA